jgi:pimeloyl-ACP methyl ester carboxylesterase
MDTEIESKINWMSNTLESKEKTIHYYSYITGAKPFFFFLHGITDNGLCYDRVAESFADQFNIIMPDARGHGKSSDPSKKCSFQDMAIDFKDICEHLKIDKIYVLGHSMGGAQAAVFASMFADHVKAVILEDPAIVMHKSLSILMKIAIPFLSIFTVFSNKNTQSLKNPKGKDQLKNI